MHDERIYSLLHFVLYNKNIILQIKKNTKISKMTLCGPGEEDL